ncbi:Electron transport complex subunit RsxD [wastewater metagenome]|uniref:Electron transport complex subunit RsxD n=2 Tax=unclassified sequences TaxID=12908 RepID=A0A5B8R689_9ZZZZ|nr:MULTISPECIES: RnfABCDGE type electron transport complex subunit D [Arhodomonas]QEA04459.1 electron transport complex subunit RsxD [uncultured organism]
MTLRQAVSPHLRPPRTVGGTMRLVLYALVPGVLGQLWFFGAGVLWQIGLATATAVATEAAMLHLRGRPLALFLRDWSAVVTAVLLAVSLPGLAPWWMAVLGTAFGLVFAKHLYGGLGHNPFNPAMVGYVVLLVAFPRLMSQWPAPAGLAGGAPGPIAAAHAIFGGGVDAVTAATPLDAVRTQLGQALTLPEIRQGPLWGALGGRGWAAINGLYLAGGAVLVATRTADWRIPAGVLAGIGVPAAFLWAIDPSLHPGLWFHWASGATMLGAFFIATDPVSAATTPRGRLIFGAGIGVLTWLIRTWGGYPDAIAFAVLLMNMAVPLIDRYTPPRIYGHPRGGGHD